MPMKFRINRLTIISTSFFCLLLFGFSCSTYLEFNTQKNAEPRFSGINSVGVNTVLVRNHKSIKLNDNMGHWTASFDHLNSNRLESLVRKSLVSNLQKFSDYQVYDLHYLRRFQHAYNQLRPLSGERISGIDLIIDVQVSVQGQQQTGQTQQVMNFRRQTRRLQGKEWIITEDIGEERVVTLPYSHTNVDISCYVEVIKTKDGDSRVLKAFNSAISNRIEPMTSLEGTINELGVVIAGRVLKNTSKYSVRTQREIDTGSEDEVIELLEKADIEKATNGLEARISEGSEKNPADLYNLGICYEALGDPVLALQMYREAHDLDMENELYIKAIGDLE